MTTIDPPLKWHGGKHYLAKKIIALMPKHIHYVEPYFGGGSVLLAKDPEGVSEVANDLNKGLSNFWSVLRDGEWFQQFRRLAEATPFSEAVFNSSVNGDAIEEDAPRQAYWFFVRCRQSMSGRMKDFAPLSRTRTRRNMNEQASAWINAVDGLPEVYARIRRVVILNRPAIEVIASEDKPDTLFYLDPPYLHETRASTGEYEHEMTAGQHKELLSRLGGVKGKFLLSGYDSELYREFEQRNHWTRRAFELPNNSAGGEKKRRMQEIVWMNFEPVGV